MTCNRAQENKHHLTGHQVLRSDAFPNGRSTYGAITLMYTLQGVIENHCNTAKVLHNLRNAC